MIWGGVPAWGSGLFYLGGVSRPGGPFGLEAQLSLQLMEGGLQRLPLGVKLLPRRALGRKVGRKDVGLWGSNGAERRETTQRPERTATKTPKNGPKDPLTPKNGPNDPKEWP